MNKTIWVIGAVIVVLLGGWFIYNSMQTPVQLAGNTEIAPDPNAISNPTSNVPDANTIYVRAGDPTKGTYMTDPAGKTLYVFDNDTTPGQSSCTGGCATVWPPYTTTATAGSALPTGITLIVRSDGASQYAYNGKPLYYYAKDVGLGDFKGDGVGGIWHIVKL